MRVLLRGRGFIGSHVCDAFLARDEFASLTIFPAVALAAFPKASSYTGRLLTRPACPR